MPGKKTKGEPRTAIIASGDAGLYYGDITATDEEINAAKMVRVTNCRHIAYWEGKEGGITSLAEHGPLDNGKSRIGLATSSPAAIMDVRNVFPVSPAAAARFLAAVKP